MRLLGMLSAGPLTRFVFWVAVGMAGAHLWGILLIKVFRIEPEDDWLDYRSPFDMQAHFFAGIRPLIALLGILAVLSFIGGL